MCLYLITYFTIDFLLNNQNQFIFASRDEPVVVIYFAASLHAHRTWLQRRKSAIKIRVIQISVTGELRRGAVFIPVLLPG